MKNKIFSVLLVGLFLFVSQTTIVKAAGVVGSGTPASCTEAALDTALAGGGLVTFNCGAGAVTIPLTTQKIISADTTIDGGGLITLNGSGAVRHFEVQTGATLTLNNLTLTNGSAVGANGGSVLVNVGGALFTTNVIFSSNLAGVNGGAVANSGTSNLLNTTFTNNQSTGVGGAIYTTIGTTTMDNSTFTGNNAPGLNDDGGAIVLDGGTLTINDSLFDNNYSEDKGGAIDVYSGTMNITDSTFQNHNNPLITEGGAIYVNTGAITLSGVAFTNNQTFEADGGAIYFNGTGSLTIQSSASRASSFIGNIAYRDGGAIFIENGGGVVMSVSDATFDSNATNGNNTATPLGGGAIYHGANSLLTITDSTFNNNSATGDGGAIWMGNANGELAISGSTFSYNTASDDGGAIYNNTNPFPGVLNITSSIFSHNAANGDDGVALGGAIYNTPDAINTNNRITLTSFISNQANSSTGNALGGAIYHAGNRLTLANVTFSGNNANKTIAGVDDPQGGALYVAGGATVYNTTFSNNSVTETGGAVTGGGSIYNAGTATLANTIVASGFPNNCSGVAITDSGNNIDFDGGSTCGAGFSSSDPGLQALTGSPAYYPISAASAALDAGNNTICANTFVNNQSQNGLTRPIDGDGDTTATCDIGSFERSADNVSPTVTINQAAAQADPTNSSPILFTVEFSEAVTGFTDSDVTLGGTAGATTAVVSGSGTTYTVSVSGMTVTGTVTASIPANAAFDGANNGNTASTSTDNSVTYDITAPTVTINQAAAQADPTNSSPILFTVEFSEAVTGFTNADVTLGGTAGATTAVVSGSGTTYTVSVSGMTTTGTVTASIPANAAVDGANNGNAASTSTDNSVTYDATGPTVTINQAAAQADPTNSSPILFTVEFSEAVTGFTDADVTLGGTAGATTAVVSGSGTTYSVSVSGMTTTGTVTASIPANAAVDGANNGNAASTSTDNSVTYDITAPTVTINQAAAQADPTSSSPILFTVEFSEAVTGFTNADVTLGGTAGATTAVVSGSGTTYQVSVSGMTVTGTVTASIPANAAVDGANNGNTASTSTDNSVTYDVTGPTVTINQAAAQADPTNSSPILFTVEFSEPVTGFTNGDVTLGGTAGATTAVVTGSGTTYEVAVSGMTATGTVTASIPADVAVDGSNNGNMNSSSTDNTVTYDITAPTVTIDQAAAQADPTSASPILFTVEFSEPVTGFTDADVTLGGTAGATTAVVSGSGTTYEVAVSGMTVTGTVTASIPANAAVDGANNGNTASTSTDNSVTFDVTGPTVTINQAAAQADPTSTSPILFTVEFSEPVTGFTDADVILSGTAGANTAVVTGSGTTYEIAVSGMTTYGTVIVTIPADAAVDESNNGNMASSSTDNTVTYAEEETETPTTPEEKAAAPVVLPNTGFSPGVVSSLPNQPAEKAYASTDLVLEIPSLGVEMSIVGVPQMDGTWDVSWLGSNAGYLDGSAFPTWAGNTILTGHVWDANNNPGPFAQIRSLQYGDKIEIHAWGQTFVYEVRESNLAFPNQVSSVFQHKEYDWVTLVTCEAFSSDSDSYLYRRVIRAVLVEVH